MNGNFWNINDYQAKEKLQEKWMRSNGPQKIAVIEKIVILVQTYTIVHVEVLQKKQRTSDRCMP